eukprot:TRINITY_DN12836_c0_g1_i4.p2 TRINITY_DN12836_c0_g1~~TRINITY_DN12836_c0_g1_i4.p2  ORF type:complete len:158 (+),score=27.43 TRINITY_DN12836_c0_g1_i4:185-658(+)
MGSSSSSEDRKDRYSKVCDDGDELRLEGLQYGPCVRNTLLISDAILLIAGALMIVLEKSVLLRVLGAVQGLGGFLGLISAGCRCRRVLIGATIFLFGIGVFDGVKVALYLKKSSPPAGQLALAIGEVLFVTVICSQVGRSVQPQDCRSMWRWWCGSS